jgi:curved DNA-binding protein CbpA
VGADLVTVRAAWRARVKENHPDRLVGDPDAQRRAADRLRAINEAYDALRRHLERDTAR